LADNDKIEDNVAGGDGADTGGGDVGKINDTDDVKADEDADDAIADDPPAAAADGDLPIPMGSTTPGGSSEATRLRSSARA
jgi:hypothetical protein